MVNMCVKLIGRCGFLPSLIYCLCMVAWLLNCNDYWMVNNVLYQEVAIGCGVCGLHADSFQCSILLIHCYQYIEFIHSTVYSMTIPL